MQNPYQPPRDDPTSAPRAPLGRHVVKWLVASLGALLVTVGALLAVLILPAILVPVVYKSLAGLIAMYAIGAPLAIVAGVASFRATLRQYRDVGG
jgi:hypothetical protein